MANYYYPAASRGEKRAVPVQAGHASHAGGGETCWNLAGIQSRRTAAFWSGRPCMHHRFTAATHTYCTAVVNAFTAINAFTEKNGCTDQ